MSAGSRESSGPYGVYELIGGKVSINRLREVDINDLLRREPVRVGQRSGRRRWLRGARHGHGRGRLDRAGAVPSDRAAIRMSWFFWVTARTVF